MKLFPAKCHERATLRKRQTGNSSLLPAKCWPLLHVMAGISARLSNFAFVLFCSITNHLMTGPLENSEFCFPRISMFPSTSSRETLKFSGNKIHCSLRDQSLSVKCCFLFENSTQYSNWNAAIWLAELLVHFVVAVGCLTKGDVSSFSRSFEGKFKCKRIIRLIRLKTNRKPLTKTWNYGKDGRTHAESWKFLMSIHFRAILGECKAFNITWKNNLKLLLALISIRILLKGLDYSLSVSISLHTAGAYEIWIDQSGFSRWKSLYCSDEAIAFLKQERH